MILKILELYVTVSGHKRFESFYQYFHKSYLDTPEFISRGRCGFN